VTKQAESTDPYGAHAAGAPIIKERPVQTANLNPFSHFSPSSLVGRYVCLAIALVGLQASAVLGQALPTASTRLIAGFAVTAGGMNTQLPYYADNALGYNVGLYLQPYSLLGVEVRGGFYPISARFEQVPVTAGLRFEQRESRTRWPMPFAYFGGGFSKAQDSSTGYKPLPAIWSPCWQASQGVDIPLGRIKWRVYEAT
jgi:hypothetical protein